MFSRDELLGGLPARRASTILFAIEGEAARLVAASRINRAGYAAERTVAEREQDFLKALRSGVSLPNPPTIIDLERFADRWATLVPDADDVRAELARMLGAKYRFRSADVPRIAAALHLGDGGVAAAFERLHGRPLDTIYAPSLPLREQLRWRLGGVIGRFDRVHPFWIAYFFAFTEVLGEGMMSLPLVLAGFGPLPGILLILGFGLVNLLTVGAMAEAVVRNGSIRYGAAYLSRLIHEFLGRTPAAAMAVIIAIDAFFALWFYFLGFGSVLDGATGIPIGIWMLVLFAVCVVLLRKEALDDTIASAILTGLTTITLAVVLTIWALLNLDPANLRPVPGPSGDGLPDLAVVGLVFGVLLMAFFAHTSSANSAKLLLSIEPSGRSLIRGNLAAMATVIVFYAISTTAIVGAVGPELLLETNGTAFTPLTEVLGPGAAVVAVAYTLLAIGIGSLWVLLGTYSMVVELLPRVDGGAGPVADDSSGIRVRVGRALAWLGATRARRLVAGFAPAAAVVLLLEVAVVLGVDDFAGSIAFAGTLTVPLITGVLPMLLVAAARRTGEYVPQPVHAVLGHPIVVVVVVLAFVVGIAAHVVLWSGPIERLAAAGFAVGSVLLIAGAIRNRAFRPRATVELRVDEQRGRATISVIAGGRVVQPPTAVQAGGPRGAGEVAGVVAAAGVPAGPWRRLRVWPHQVSPDGWSTTLAAEATVRDAAGERTVSIAAGANPVIVDVSGEDATVEVRLT